MSTACNVKQHNADSSGTFADKLSISKTPTVTQEYVMPDVRMINKCELQSYKKMSRNDFRLYPTLRNEKHQTELQIGQSAFG